MKYEVIHSKYKDYSTKYYIYWTPETGLKLSTRKRDLPKVHAITVVSPDNPKMIVFCPSCNNVHIFSRHYSDFYLYAAEKAKNCKEYLMFDEMFSLSHNLAWFLVKGGELKLPAKLNPEIARKFISIANALGVQIPDRDRAKIFSLAFK